MWLWESANTSMTRVHPPSPPSQRYIEKPIGDCIGRMHYKIYMRRMGRSFVSEEIRTQPFSRDARGRKPIERKVRGAESKQKKERSRKGKIEIHWEAEGVRGGLGQKRNYRSQTGLVGFSFGLASFDSCKGCFGNKLINLFLIYFFTFLFGRERGHDTSVNLVIYSLSLSLYKFAGFIEQTDRRWALGRK